MKKYARCCDSCGKGMNKGYHDAGNYYCSDECLIEGNSTDTLTYTMADWNSDCDMNSEVCYYTEWDELDEDGFYLEDGTYVELNNE